jgi:hypothetical protein
MLEAGNYTLFQNYLAGVMLTSNATTYLDCYKQCMDLNGGQLSKLTYLAATLQTMLN